MSSSYTNLLYHVVFSTKDREPLLHDTWRARLHEYLGGTVNGLKGQALGVGGVADHVHLLVLLRATHCLADFMRELKKTSSVWVAELMPGRKFSWQEGYAAFTVSASGRRTVQEYIANQAEHHRRRSFREELVELLTKSEVKFDERYLE